MESQRGRSLLEFRFLADCSKKNSSLHGRLPPRQYCLIASECRSDDRLQASVSACYQFFVLTRCRDYLLWLLFPVTMVTVT